MKRPIVHFLRIAACIAVILTTSARVAAQESGPDATGFKAAVQAVEQFHAALSGGDSLTVAGLLTDDARILESGGAETKDEYLRHHFHNDAAFLAAMTSEPKTNEVFGKKDVAWVTSTSRLHGTYHKLEIDLNSAELMVLRRTDDGWRIAAIHWSSRSK